MQHSRYSCKLRSRQVDTTPVWMPPLPKWWHWQESRDMTKIKMSFGWIRWQKKTTPQQDEGLIWPMLQNSMLHGIFCASFPGIWPRSKLHVCHISGWLQMAAVHAWAVSFTQKSICQIPIMDLKMRYTSFSICMGNLLCLTDASSSTLVDTREHWRDWKDSSEVSRASSTPFRTISRHPNMCSRSPLGPTQATKPPKLSETQDDCKKIQASKNRRKEMTVLQKISKNSRYPPSSGSMILRWNIEVLEISNPVPQGKARWGVIRLDQPRKNCNSYWPECLALADCQWQCLRCYHPAVVFEQTWNNTFLVEHSSFRKNLASHVFVVWNFTLESSINSVDSILSSTQHPKAAKCPSIAVRSQWVSSLKECLGKNLCISKLSVSTIQKWQGSKKHTNKMIKPKDFRIYKPTFPQVFKRQDALCNLGLVEHLVNLEGHQPTTNVDAPPVSGRCRFGGGDWTSWWWI